LRPVSARRRREQRRRREIMRAVYGDRPLCEVRWDDRCRGWADAPHELRKASQGGSRVDPANALPACHFCNGQVENEPLEAHRRGLV